MEGEAADEQKDQEEDEERAPHSGGDGADTSVEVWKGGRLVKCVYHYGRGVGSVCNGEAVVVVSCRLFPRMTAFSASCVNALSRPLLLNGGVGAEVATKYNGSNNFCTNTI